jgi:hypothetical protein
VEFNAGNRVSKGSPVVKWRPFKVSVDIGVQTSLETPLFILLMNAEQ